MDLEAVKALSHPLRVNILRLLRDSSGMSFTEILRRLGLNIEKDCGLLDYHLKKLKASGLIDSSDGVYRLTDRGLSYITAFDEEVSERLDNGRSVNVDSLIIDFFKGSHVNLLRELFSRKFSGRVLDSIVHRLKALVSGRRHDYRSRLIERLRTVWSGDEERFSILAIYENSIVGFLTGIIYREKPFRYFPRDDKGFRIEDLSSREVKVLAVTGLWVSSRYKVSDILERLLRRLDDYVKNSGVGVIEWILFNSYSSDSIYRGVINYLLREGFIQREVIYMVKFIEDNVGVHLLPLNTVLSKVKSKSIDTWIMLHINFPENVVSHLKCVDEE